jgi:hypothetical protein
MRTTDLKLMDRLEQGLRVLHAKNNKKPKTESLIAAINSVTAELKSETTQQAFDKYMQE